MAKIQKSILLGSDWHPVDKCSAPPLVHSWLSDPGSLTEKLKHLPGEFRVHLINQEEAMAESSEYAALGIEPQRVVIREVVLYSDNKPMVFARSILPFQTQTENSEFINLGSNPLGERLFHRADIEPGAIESALFPVMSNVGKLNIQLNGEKKPIWGRRRCFHRPNNSILVAEVFLSSAPCYS